MTLRGVKPAFSAAAIASRTTSSCPRRRMAANRSGRSESQLTLTRRSPAAASSSATLASSVPLVVMARSSNPTAESRPMSDGSPLRTSGSPPVMRRAETPRPLATLGQSCDFVERQQFVLRQEGEPFFGHAVDAAQIAAIGHRNAEVVVHPPVAIDQRSLERHGLRQRDRTVGATAVRSDRNRDGYRRRHGASDRTATGCLQYERRIGAQPIGIDEEDADLLSGVHAGAIGQEDQRIGLGHGMELMGLLAAGGSDAPRCWIFEMGERTQEVKLAVGSPGADRPRWWRRQSGRCRMRCPPRRRSAGRTNSSKLTMADTGFPGSPNTGVAESANTPNANGFAGLMATCIQRIFPALNFSSTTRTRSRSPTLTPPLVMMASQVDAAERQQLAPGRTHRPHDPEVDAVPPFAADEGQQGVPVGVADLAGGERAGPREELVAGGEHADPRTGMDPHTERTLIGENTQMRGSEHGPGRGR